MNKKIIVVCVIFILLSTIVVAFFDTIQQAMIFLQAGSNIKLTPNPIVTSGKISLVDDPSFGISPNQFSINKSGALELTGRARPSRELIFKATNAVRGSSSPTETLRDVGASGGVKDPVIAFSKTTQQDIFGTFHHPHEMDSTTNVAFHLMWIPGESWTSGAYNWSLEYLLRCETIEDEAELGAGCADSTLGTPITISEIVTPDNAVDFIETEFSTTIDMEHNHILIAHFFRDIRGADTADDVGEVRFFEVEYTKNTLGKYK
ncbi:hypothetical protein LCGC14_0651240 [marine sediment metagenome]|uniref:Uncharacterized protein n=1 Tax=marine sediment metagenome TaxID=412755 RepID=A0A0F9QW89_9ZZZZ